MNDYGISPVVHDLMRESARMRAMSSPQPEVPVDDKLAVLQSSLGQLLTRAGNFCRRQARAMREMTRKEMLAYVAPAWREGAMISRAIYMVCDAKADWNRDDGHAWDEVLAWEIRNPPWSSNHKH